MKHLSLLLWLLALSTITLKGQDSTGVLKIAEVMPKYATGDTGLYQFIKQNIQYPQLCIDSGIQGKVYVRFVVGADGAVKNAEVIKGVCSLLNDEATRVVNKLPSFIPGKNKGKNVDVYYVVPINFLLPGSKKSDIFQVLSTCNVQPRYEGGDEALDAFLSANTKAPADDYGTYIQGENTVGFLIDTIGKVSGVRIIKPASAVLDSEAVRVIKLLKPFVPALLAGKKVSSYLTITFNFNRYAPPIAPLHQLKNPATISGGDDYIYSQLEKDIKIPAGVAEPDSGYFSISLKITERGVYESKEFVSADNEKKYWVKKQALLLLPAILRTVTAAKKNDTAIASYYDVSFVYKLKNGKVIFDRKNPILKSGMDQMVFRFVDKSPEFEGGDAELLRFLQHHIIYPKMERDNDIQGKVLVRFIIDETGKVTDAQVVRSVSAGLDREALRVINLFPPFKPGEQNGEKVKVYFNLPVVFKLQ